MATFPTILKPRPWNIRCTVISCNGYPSQQSIALNWSLTLKKLCNSQNIVQVWWWYEKAKIILDMHTIPQGFHHIISRNIIISQTFKRKIPTGAIIWFARVAPRIKIELIQLLSNIYISIIFMPNLKGKNQTWNACNGTPYHIHDPTTRKTKVTVK